MAKKIRVKSYRKKNGTKVRSHLRTIRGYGVIQVKKPSDVKKFDMDFLLDNFDFEDELEGLYFVIPESIEEGSKIIKPVKKEEDMVGVVVHNRIFGEEVNIYTDKEGNKYIKADDFEELF